MLPERTQTILKIIIEQHITAGMPVPSQNITHKYGLEVSSATVRNEMAYLKREGYIIQPHTSAGSIPSDKGYRYYVENLSQTRLPVNQQLTISHLFHQVETRLDEWAKLSATILAHLAQNMSVVATVKSNRSIFKHLELVSLQDTIALIVLVLQGARLRQRLTTFDQAVSQVELSTISNKLNNVFSGLSHDQIQVKKVVFSEIERQIIEDILAILKAEDDVEYQGLYLDGLQFMFSQPEFAGFQTSLALMSLMEQKDILKTILPRGLIEPGVHIFIGKENESETMQKCSVVVSQYGLPGEAVGCVAVVGPTRMPYALSIASVDYLAEVLTRLITRLYGREFPPESNTNN